MFKGIFFLPTKIFLAFQRFLCSHLPFSAKSFKYLILLQLNDSQFDEGALNSLSRDYLSLLEPYHFYNALFYSLSSCYALDRHQPQ